MLTLPGTSPTSGAWPQNPPNALLMLPDGSEHAGKLGSYCYRGTCGDTPWLPASSMARVEASSSDALALRLADGLDFTSWLARYAAADDTTGTNVRTLARGGADDGAALTEAAFGPPPSGEWVVSVFVRFPDEIEGDASYYWYLAVP